MRQERSLLTCLHLECLTALQLCWAKNVLKQGTEGISYIARASYLTRHVSVSQCHDHTVMVAMGYMLLTKEVTTNEVSSEAGVFEHRSSTGL